MQALMTLIYEYYHFCNIEHNMREENSDNH